MPVGKSDFEKVRISGDYYIDKTDLISQITASGAEVTLFTRPRRFGKSLNMSMLQHFFDIREDSKALFEGLKICENTELCDKWMNKYPTILVSFKDVGGTDFKISGALLSSVISKLYEKYKYLITDNLELSRMQINLFESYLMRESSTADLTDCLFLLTDIMYHYYNKPVILIIDEYDVPMAKGDANDYYREITDIMRYMLSKALKDNPYIKIAVLTGCLKIAQESIFTGLNNLSIKTITDTDYDECFGFTNEEMNKLLSDTGLTEHRSVFKEWYDGYIFGNKEVYCPWDVLNYVNELQGNPKAPPANYWAYTSGNDVIKKFLDSDYDVSEDFETLLGGGYVEKIINPNITYGDLTKDETNLWSVLYMTGYLTILPGSLPVMTSLDPDKVRGLYELPFKLKLPNKEICMLFRQTVSVWFEKKISEDDRTELFEAVWNGDAESLTEIISDYLYNTISYYDYHENYYHAFLTGLMTGKRNIIVKSNMESGRGRADIIVKNKAIRSVAVFELKRASSEEGMEKACDEALEQISNNKYYVPFKREKVINYGIAFYGKDCLVKKG